MKTVQLPNALRELMETRGLSVRALSKQTKLPVSTLSSYLSDKKASYAPEHLRILSEYFGVSIDWLLFKIVNKNASLELLKTESVFSGWLKVKIERAIPDGAKDE